MNLSNIIKKLKSDKQFRTEEETKNGLILPFFMNLGYDVFDTDEFKPEVSADIGVKQGEKVDFAIYIDEKPIMIIECKQRDKRLDNHINQLYRYFTAMPELSIAVLTNGDDYWFFTDSKKPNIMDLEPYLKVKLSTATKDELDQLERYTKENIVKLDVKRSIKLYAINNVCNSLANSLISGNIPDYIVKAIIKEANIVVDEQEIVELTNIIFSNLNGKLSSKISLDDTVESTSMDIEDDDIELYINRDVLGNNVNAKALLHTDNTMTLLEGSIVNKNMQSCVKSIIERVELSIKDGVVIQNIECKSPSNAAVIVLGNKANGLMEWKTSDGRNINDLGRGKGYTRQVRQSCGIKKSDISNIKLNHEYVYNDYSDGEWTHHSIDYCILFGRKIYKCSAKDILILTIDELFKQGKLDRDKVFSSGKFTNSYAIQDKQDDNRKYKLYYMEAHDIYVNTTLNVSTIISFIEKLFELAKVSNDSLKISFRN